jgi:CheY-like chemotaxis protein
VSGAHFSIERLTRLQDKSVTAALDWLRANASLDSDAAERCATLDRRALFACMVEQSLPIPLDLLGIRSLLMVDDEPAVLRSMARVLRQVAPELTLHLADGAEGGISQLAAQRPGAMLIDAYMPVTSGVEVCARIVAQGAAAHTVIVGMTADPSPELASAFARAGAVAFLEKPVDLPVLFEALSVHQNAPNSAGDSQ